MLHIDKGLLPVASATRRELVHEGIDAVAPVCQGVPRMPFGAKACTCGAEVPVETRSKVGMPSRTTGLLPISEGSVMSTPETAACGSDGPEDPGGEEALGSAVRDRRLRPPVAMVAPDTTAEPDVWWGHDGIDALIWADPVPYVLPTPAPEHLANDDGGDG